MQTLKKFALNSQEARKTRLSQYYFNPVLLWLYDTIVYRLVSKYFWGISATALKKRYQTLTGKRHLEVGVGTGFLLDDNQLVFQTLTLMDLSDACLRKSTRRLARFKPESIRHNILNAYHRTTTEEPYDSIAINYVLHCIPGGYLRKAVVFQHLSRLLTEDGVLFGASVLKTKNTAWYGKLALALLNGAGIFNNQADNTAALKSALAKSFKYFAITETKTAVLFQASHQPLAI